MTMFYLLYSLDTLNKWLIPAIFTYPANVTQGRSSKYIRVQVDDGLVLRRVSSRTSSVGIQKYVRV